MWKIQGVPLRKSRPPLLALVIAECTETKSRGLRAHVLQNASSLWMSSWSELALGQIMRADGIEEWSPHTLTCIGKLHVDAEESEIQSSIFTRWETVGPACILQSWHTDQKPNQLQLGNFIERKIMLLKHMLLAQCRICFPFQTNT